jgi:hypothetical protein
MIKLKKYLLNIKKQQLHTPTHSFTHSIKITNVYFSLPNVLCQQL